MAATRPRPTSILVTDEEWERYRPRLIAAAIQRRLSRPEGSRTAQQILADCQESFAAFLPFWKFKNRDTGKVLSFAKLWRGQERLVWAMTGDHDRLAELPEEEQRWTANKPDGTPMPLISEIIRRKEDAYPAGPWLFMLKGGKLGFTELECAYDAWVALFRCDNARVHLFSRDLSAAKELLRIVKYGLLHLPAFFRVRIADEADSETTTTLRLVAGLEDIRTIKSYATGENVSIDMVAHHCHLDEFAHMKRHKEIWEDVQTTVAPGGTLHIVTRGAGDDAFIMELWGAAEAGEHELVPFFAPWVYRDDRDQEWYEREANKNTSVGHSHFAPNIPADALMGDAQNDYIPVGVWDACFDPLLAPLYHMEDDRLVATRDPLILALDAAVTQDCFAGVLASRHPDHEPPCHRTHDDPAIRGVKVWRPEDFPGHEIDFDVAEGWVRAICQGGCPGDNAHEAHPRYPAGQGTPTKWTKQEDCLACQAGVELPPLNVIRVVYDRTQLMNMVQRCNNDGVWQSSKMFDQGAARVAADSGMYSLAIQHRLAHNGDETMRDHIKNARAKLQPNEDSKMRIVKKDDKRKIDAAVAASMAVEEVLRLYL